IRKIVKKGGIVKKPEKEEKIDLIESLFDYEIGGILEPADIDELRKVVKQVIEEIRYNQFKVLTEKLKVAKGATKPKDTSTENVSKSEENEQSKAEGKKPEESVSSEVFHNGEDVDSTEVNDSEESEEDREMGERGRVHSSLHKDDWETFIEQMEMYFEAKEIKADKQKSNLLTQVDTDTFKLIKQLLTPENIKDKSYDDIVKVMNEHLNPKPSEVMERCNFNTARQESSETVAEFAAKLKKLSLKCDFKTNLNDALRDQFVVGLKNHDTRVALFKKEKLPFEDALKEATAQEAAEINASGTSKIIGNQDRKREVFALRSTQPHWKNKSTGRRTEQGTRQPSKRTIKQVCRSRRPNKNKDQQRVQLMQDDDESGGNGQIADEAGGSFENKRDFLYLNEHEEFVCKQVMSDKDIEGNPMFKNSVDVSEWATPIVPVFKSNGNIRICGDFKMTLNPHIIMDIYPLHTIDDIFAKLQNGDTFTELDLTHAYMQFPVEEECSKLLTIVTHVGLFRYTKVPEGVSPAPADVQKKMDECLRGLQGTIAYIDNIYVTGKTTEEHLKNLENVCNRLQECGLRVNREK
ncbi:uncharacterized protein LOC107274076, partial [Cephus cinctus]|uniref:Uncharacterized protein LOC107274076 n=1 Tax=Cephus cinctus TaxID=211228 RepID=A0AAJ7CEN7_CEPCN